MWEVVGKLLGRVFTRRGISFLAFSSVPRDSLGRPDLQTGHPHCRRFLLLCSPNSESAQMVTFPLHRLPLKVCFSRTRYCCHERACFHKGNDTHAFVSDYCRTDTERGQVSAMSGHRLISSSPAAEQTCYKVRFPRGDVIALRVDVMSPVVSFQHTEIRIAMHIHAG
jgi:hypothetical protein